jgi:hypothetical protein
MFGNKGLHVAQFTISVCAYKYLHQFCLARLYFVRMIGQIRNQRKTLI